MHITVCIAPITTSHAPIPNAASYSSLNGTLICMIMYRQWLEGRFFTWVRELNVALLKSSLYDSAN